MPSETDLLNDALGQVGAARITGIDEGTPNANRCKDFYPSLRDSLLRAHFWNFALARVQLAQDVTAPVYGYVYAYTLPPDCLRVKAYAGGDPAGGLTWIWWETQSPAATPYKIEGRRLVSNDSSVYIEYVKRETNPAVWAPDFYQVVATQLASKLALSIMKDPKLAGELMRLAEGTLLPAAVAADGQEGSSEPYIVDDLTRGR